MRSVIAALLCLLVALTPVPALAADAAYGFEDGTAQGWQPRGDGVTVTATAAAAHTGAAALHVAGRTANWHGASLPGPFEPGVQYTVTAYARLVSGGPATVALTVQRTPAGGEATYERVASATVTDTGWTRLSGTYTLAPSSTDVQLYAESADESAAFYLDDIALTALTDPARTPISTDFEDGTAQDWAARGAATLTATAGSAHAGAHGLAVTGRSASWDGPALNVLGRMAKGDKYALSVWVRGTGKLGLSIERRAGDAISYERVVAPAEAGEWVRLQGSYTLAHDADFLSVYVESETGTEPFDLDDFTLAYVEPKPIETGIPALKDVVPFTMGTAFTPAETFGEHAKLLARHFDGVTPGNDLKWDAVQPAEGQFAFAQADALVGFAAEHGMTVRGHTLAWHSQTPAWVFEGADKQTLLARLETHVRTVVGRYKGRIAAWDVVNEVIDENQPDGMRRSPWFEIAGLDFIRTAFRVARETDPDAELFINDYNTEFPRKREALYDLVERLRAEGVPIDGVGHQLHLNVEQPPASWVEDTVERFAALGVDQHVTELDVSVYTDFVSSYDTIPPELLAAQGHRYKELFDVFRRQADRLSSVTIWGKSDDVSWLRSFPITRLNAPLPFDDDLQAKPAYWGIADPSKLPALVRSLEAPAASPRVDGERELAWDLLPDTPVARVGDVSAGWQARSSERGLYVLAEVEDATRDRADRVTFTLGGTPYTVWRDGRPGDGFRAAVRRTRDGYRVEALLPSRASDIEVAVGEARWAGRLTFTPAVEHTTAARGEPVLDGVVDAAWARAPRVRTGTRIEGASGASATVRSLWRGDTLYVLAEVSDAQLSEESPNPWEQDSVEIFVDPGNNKTKGYDDDDGQYRISFTGTRTVGGTFDAFAVKDNLTGAARAVPGGYVVEAAIKLPTVPLRKGTLLGFDVQVNDATGAARTGAATWHDATGRSYLDTSHWGVLRLSR
ncbi:endo-1,4-beta-xylanase [Nonomuraea sp. SBT364]|uniref:endo-1,4-beta-xylanase n=1 Tax=Nonomuraea sp. SBT364 TaxID=1580530 RepID=UPI00066D9EB4|nr:endo-1,4-beta-xylanase [Nonomuraea sp. SBT364]